jgi:hypothetical protein
MRELNKANLFELDPGFPERVFDTSLFTGMLLIVCSTALNSMNITLSLAAGVAISLAFCRVLWWSIRRFMQPGPKGQKPVFLLLGIIKYVAMGVALFFLFKHFDVHIVALFVGLSTVQAVITLKFLSLLLVDFLNKSVKVPSVHSRDVF